MSTNVGSIKDRMKSMRSDIDAANEDVRVLQTQIEAQTQRADDAELKCEELNKRLFFLDDNKSEKEEELKALKRRMDEIESESDENRRYVKVLESKGVNNDDRLTELQQTLTKQTSEIERLDRLSTELQRRAQDAEEALEDAEEKGLHLKSILDDNMEELNQLRNNYKSLCACQQKMSENEEKCLSNIHDLESKCEETCARADRAEDNVKALQQQACSLEEELEVWNDKIRSTERELEQTYAEIQEM